MSLNKTETNKYFDNIAESYGVNDHLGNVNKLNAFKYVLLSLDSGKTILECGGGGGFYTLNLLKLGYTLVTIDLSLKALELNKKNAEKQGLGERLTVIHGDFNSACSQVNMDINQVLFIKVLHHFDNLDEIQTAVCSGFNLLSEGGRVVIFEPNGKNILWKLFYSLKKDKRTGKSMWFYEQNTKLITPLNMGSIAQSLGHNYILSYKYVLPGFLISRNTTLSRMLSKLNSFLERSFLRFMAFNLLIVIEKKA
ncbi:MAG: ubiquinone/menaquinone biosynthesis C-methylase UbiE [Patiriisocius sp.]|jgi:ubiquinone/menaquinone biosynthesis C-methylase UbiE